MDVRFKCAITMLIVGVSSGCATVLPAGSAGSALTGDVYTDLRAEIADRPPVPSGEYLMPSVELVTFPYEADGATKRDTVRGREDVAEWFGAMADRTGGDRVPFLLRTSEVMICESSAVERGQYPVPSQPTMQPGSTADYLAVWRPREGDWALQRIWLSPPPSAGADDLATDCVREPWGLTLGAGLGMGSASDLADVAAAVPSRYDEVSHTEGASRPELQLWASIRALPWLRGQLRYAYRHHADLHALNFSSVTGDTIGEFSLEARVHYLSVLAEARFGPLGVAIGPMLVETRLESTYPGVEPSWLYVEVGGEARAFGAVRLSRSFQASFSAGYRHVPELHVSPFIGARSGEAYLNVGGINLTIGFEFVL